MKISKHGVARETFPNYTSSQKLIDISLLTYHLYPILTASLAHNTPFQKRWMSVLAAHDVWDFCIILSMNFLHMLPFDFIYFLIDDSNKQPL
jgi:hypothetical protein